MLVENVVQKVNNNMQIKRKKPKKLGNIFVYNFDVL